VFNTTVNNSSVTSIMWWSVLLMFSATVNNSSVILWGSVVLVFNTKTVVLNYNKTDHQYN
jgi:hypothetical protein